MTTKKFFSFDVTKKCNMEKFSSIYVPIFDEKDFFVCLCCGRIAAVQIAGNIIDIYCHLPKGKKIAKHCSNTSHECPGIARCKYKDEIDVIKRDEMLSYIKDWVSKLLLKFDVVFIHKNNESRKVIAEIYYTSNDHEVTDSTIDGDNYIRIKFLKERLKNEKKMRREKWEKVTHDSLW